MKVFAILASLICLFNSGAASAVGLGGCYKLTSNQGIDYRLKLEPLLSRLDYGTVYSASFTNAQGKTFTKTALATYAKPSCDLYVTWDLGGGEIFDFEFYIHSSGGSHVTPQQCNLDTIDLTLQDSGKNWFGIDHFAVDSNGETVKNYDTYKFETLTQVPCTE